MASRRSISLSSCVRCGAPSDASARTPKMKTSVAAASRMHATAMVTSMLLMRISGRFGAGFTLRAGQKFGRNFARGCGRDRASPAPAANHFPNKIQREHRHDDGHQPGGAVEPFRGRLSENRGAVLLDEGLEREIVRLAARHALVEFAKHFVRITAANVIALAEDLIAAANAHQF